MYLVTGRIVLRYFDHATYGVNLPVLPECLIFWFRLVQVGVPVKAWCDGNCTVDQVFHIGGLKDLQELCVCDEDPTDKKLLPTGIPEKCSQQVSPGSENFLFGYAVLSFTDLNNICTSDMTTHHSPQIPSTSSASNTSTHAPSLVAESLYISRCV
jgi:hypothetical protein